MAPDRGRYRSHSPSPSASMTSRESHELSPRSLDHHPSRDDATKQSDMGLYATHSHHNESVIENTHFTLRSVIAGLIIGTVVCFSSTYFGLQTGWISGMAMPSSLIGFAFFRSIRRHLKLPFTPVENVLVQTIAGAVGTMPLGLGYVGVMPAIQFLLKQTEGAPVDLSLWKLIVWGFGLCLFGCVFAVPLRKQVIVREKLRFPTGTATALMISVLHGGARGEEDRRGEIETQGTEEREQLLHGAERDASEGNDGKEVDAMADWKRQTRLLLIAFGGSALYTLVQYFIPILHSLPIFGTYLANVWVWTLNPSPAYVGQGIIMGPATTLHMLFGAIFGWAILSPIAKDHEWAPGPVDNWETGSKGWILWISLAIMLADAVINLGWLVLRPTVKHGPDFVRATKHRWDYTSSWKDFFFPQDRSKYFTAGGADNKRGGEDDVPDDAPPHHLISARAVAIMLPLTLVLCVVCVHVTFGEYIPISLNILALALACLLSIMGVRALGETDLNPVSGISKLTQLIFAAVTPNNKNAIMVNLIAGAVSESGALQAGDMLQDIKSGHLLGASPKAQFWGQIIGSIFGAIISPLLYKLYTSVYTIPNDLFQIPTAYVWIFTARLVTGQGLPPMAWQYALSVGAVFVVTTVLRIYLLASPEGSWKRKVHPFIPGGIAVAVGMYNTPSFTLARTVGGLVNMWYINYKGGSMTVIVVLASGLILGEGVVSIINLVLASTRVPHL